MSEDICTCDLAHRFDRRDALAPPPPPLARHRAGALARATRGLVYLLPLLLASPVRAEPAATLSQEGAALKLVALAPDASGRVRGALQIDLEPGWKTYWIAPGPVGLAPRLDFSPSTGLGPPIVSYPVPHRFREGADVSVGYEGPTAFAFEAAADEADPVVRLEFLIGLCREICVPLQGRLETSPQTGLSARAAVASAFAALPDEAPAPAGWRARLTSEGRSLALDIPFAEAPPGTELYLSGPEGWAFGEPVRRGTDPAPGLAAFDVPVVVRPKDASPALTVDVLLTLRDSARLSRSLAVERP